MWKTRPARALVLALVAWPGQACLVTNDVDYNRPNTPAVLKKVTPLDFTAVTKDCMQGSRPGMSFEVTVYDPDVADLLMVRVVVNRESEYFNQLPGTQRDPFQYCVPYDKLNFECSHVEILVSNAFVDGQPAEDPYATVDPNDIGRVEWWLLGPADVYPDVGVRACQKVSEDQQ